MLIHYFRQRLFSPKTSFQKKVVNYANLSQVRRLGGRGSARIVRISTTENYQPLFVFKGVDFLTYLESPRVFAHWERSLLP